MKKIFVLLIVLIIFSCNKYQDSEYVWRADSHENYDVLIKGKRINLIKDDIKELIFHINRSKLDPIYYSDYLSNGIDYGTNIPKIQFISLKNKTISIKIINDKYLTQKMGTSGAIEYLAEVTYTLTEHEQINSVNFIFKEGDHATPGIYTRDSFINNYKIIEP